MSQAFAIVITSINPQSKAIEEYAAYASESGRKLFVVEDRKSSGGSERPGCEMYSLTRQRQLPFALSGRCPQNNYARKNIGYLLAMKEGFDVIVETDDDNFPLANFWGPRTRTQLVPSIDHCGWVNIYQYFTNDPIWPRGFPLELVKEKMPALPANSSSQDCPIQQGLVGVDPDIDAICRMIIPLEGGFLPNQAVSLGPHAWCPFNSQNTTWFREAYALMYLPSYCSMRVCDIWRSFVAQRVAWACQWNILFESPTLYHERNLHSLLDDFEHEIPGVLHNAKICRELEDLDLRKGPEHITENLFRCYRMMVNHHWFSPRELELLELWIHDLSAL